MCVEERGHAELAALRLQLELVSVLDGLEVDEKEALTLFSLGSSWWYSLLLGQPTAAYLLTVKKDDNRLVTARTLVYSTKWR
jgi:hypothetical protein